MSGVPLAVFFLGPSANQHQASFLTMCVISMIVLVRDRHLRSYHVVGVLELLVLCLWIPATYAAARDLQTASVNGNLERSQACLGLFCSNMYVTPN